MFFENFVSNSNDCIFYRVYVDKAKVSKIKEKSGASADLTDLYSSDLTSFDIYMDRWPLAEHMSFYIPACARTAHSVSLGNSKSETTLKANSSTTSTISTDLDENSIILEEWLLDVSIDFNYIFFYGLKIVCQY